MKLKPKNPRRKLSRRGREYLHDVTLLIKQLTAAKRIDRGTPWPAQNSTPAEDIMEANRLMDRWDYNMDEGRRLGLLLRRRSPCKQN